MNFSLHLNLASCGQPQKFSVAKIVSLCYYFKKTLCVGTETEAKMTKK